VDSAGSAPNRTRRRALLALGLALLTYAVYAPAADFEFVDYDDDLLITTVPQVREGLSVDGVRWAFSTLQAANWFPLTRLSWMVDIELFGLDPGALHRTNALLHALAAALLMLALGKLSDDDWKSAWVAGVFALHPLPVESVAWVAARRDVLSGVFAAASLLAYAGAARRGGMTRHALVFALLAAGLMSKSTLVVWPFVLLLLDAWPLGRLQQDGRLAWPRVVAAVREKLPLFALVAAFALTALVAQARGEALRSLEHLPLWVRTANALGALLAYTADAFWPRRLSVFYPHPGVDVSLVAAAGGLAALVAGAAVARALWQRAPAVAVGGLWYLLALAPVIGVVQVGQAARADRYTYLPLIGLALAVAWGGAAVVPRRALALVGVASLLSLAVATRVQLEHWRDSEQLFGHALRVTERNHVAHINLAAALLRDGRLQEASAHLSAARRIVPASPAAAGLLGDVRVRQARVEEAIHLYRQAVALDPDLGRWRVALARALVLRGRFEQAERVLEGLPNQPSRSER
jgi:tetratricopeptide (TPR) repeat protein